MKRTDIRLAPDDEKVRIYEAIDQLYHQGQLVTVAEHPSGFPAITLDCADFHYLTDILSVEEWWRTHQQTHAGQ